MRASYPFNLFHSNKITVQITIIKKYVFGGMIDGQAGAEKSTVWISMLNWRNIFYGGIWHRWQLERSSKD